LPTTPSTKEHVLANYRKSKNYTDTRPSATARSIVTLIVRSFKYSNRKEDKTAAVN